MSQSAAQLSPSARVHIALATRHLAASRAFFQALFDLAPVKERPNYLKFEVIDPPINLALNAAAHVAVPPSPEHYGIQVQTTETVRYWAERMEKAGYPGRWETQVHCCYAEQDKVWVQDPDGRSWEIFMVLRDDSETYAPPAVAQHGKAVADACCAPTCCT